MEKNEKSKVSAGRIFSIIGSVLLSLIIAALVFVAAVLAYDRYIKKSSIPSFFGKSVLIIATPSMSGSIEAGDAIIIEKKDSYEVGDIITYFPAGENTSVTHRLIRIEGDKYYTKGDANPSEDPEPIYISQIAGKATGRIRGLGILIEWLRSWQGIAFLVAVAAVVVAIVMVGGKPDDSSPDDDMPEEKTAEGGNDK